MKNRIKILHIEDSLKDSELIHAIIESGGIDHDYYQTDNEMDFIGILEKGNIDIILSDFNLPDFSGSEAFMIAREKYSKIPFIFVSGTIGEDYAINAMVNGATDYVFKSKLERLVPAIKRAMRETELNLSTGKALEELRAASFYSRNLIEANLDPMVTISSKGKITDVNKSTEQITGVSRDRLIGTDFADYFTEPEKARTGYEQVFSKGIVKDYPLTMVNVTGDKRDVLYNATIYKNETGEDQGVFAVAHDITERKKNELALLESKEKWRRLVENIPDYIALLDRDARYLFLNHYAEGYSEKNVIGKKLFEFITGESQEIAIWNFETCIKSRMNKKFEYTTSELSGESSIYEATFVPFFENEILSFVMAIIRDISKLRKEEEALRHAKEMAEASDKLKTAFLNNISHEVRTPLNGILGFSEIVTETDLSEAGKKEALSMLHESSDRLLNTITNYMDISLIASGNLSLLEKNYIPGKVLTGIFDKFKTICTDKKLELFLEIPEQSDYISVNSDPEIFRKIMIHLLNNAVQFTNKGSIQFGYSISDRNLEFFVKDSGIGIAKESFSAIFEHFIKEGRDPSRFSEGSGLGLSIAKGMCEILGGKIRVESEIGKGSCFCFSFPYLKESVIPHSIRLDSETKKILSGASILVAEDDKVNFFYMQALIKQSTDSTICHASNGTEAVALYKANPDIVLILMDIKMPEMDGYEATRQIKLINKDIPVIAITGYAMTGDEEKIRMAGCDGYLSKPISKKRLLEKMAEYVSLY
jgi:PAS domain S-box-containing protein